MVKLVAPRLFPSDTSLFDKYKLFVNCFLFYAGYTAAKVRLIPSLEVKMKIMLKLMEIRNVKEVSYRKIGKCLEDFSRTQLVAWASVLRRICPFITWLNPPKKKTFKTGKNNETLFYGCPLFSLPLDQSNWTRSFVLAGHMCVAKHERVHSFF